MACIKFSFILILTTLSLSVFAQERFSSKSCLDANFSLTMNHRGILFGLLSQELTIDKKDCIIKVKHRKYLTKEWIVDICREPVHIKTAASTGVDVAKKVAPCHGEEPARETENFCGQYNELMNFLQDDGLIFAEGDRDDITTNHGRTYCAYLLLKKYLDDSVLFSRYTDVPNLFTGGIEPSFPAERVEKKEEVVVPASEATPAN